MSDLPRVAALWIGGSLTWLEQLCLTSFVEIGHPTVLYTYGEVGGVPAGVEVRDGNEIMPDPEVHTHERSGSVALFSDIFRFHLMVQAPGTIWVDTDIYCVRPLPTGPHLFGYENDKGRLNGAVLALPPESEALALLLDLTSDPYRIPPFYGGEARKELEAAAAAGKPVHAGEMVWGVWGPVAITWAVKETGEVEHAAARPVLYPVHFADRTQFFKRPMLVERQVTPETLTVHIWGRIKRIAAKRYAGGVPERCWLDQKLRQHGIDPMAAPITSHGKFDYGAAADAVDETT
ncbi:hypothetical protein [Pontivivens ytuae]|uniref:Alpha 1,4-glycosyltransferase domain-containing protein n=1 Tax=Pontivivens ytuae TaxID=2789856 RepID=A0A7S9LVA1_9RHOB|nr:hypothetical protein [Pontivivens ytuae]QPH55932.1 hypothetical protein I0K15_09480 [Pontivivens ytuae]